MEGGSRTQEKGGDGEGSEGGQEGIAVGRTLMPNWGEIGKVGGRQGEEEDEGRVGG